MVKLGAENPLAPTATPLGDVKPHELIELLVTIPTGKVSVIVPPACTNVAVVKETVIDRPLPRPPGPVRAGLYTQLVQGVST